MILTGFVPKECFKVTLQGCITALWSTGMLSLFISLVDDPIVIPWSSGISPVSGLVFTVPHPSFAYVLALLEWGGGNEAGITLN